MPLFLFLFPLQHGKRSSLQNKQVVILRMAFRARKVLGTFEKRAPALIWPDRLSLIYTSKFFFTRLPWQCKRKKYDKFFVDKCPCSKTSRLVFEQVYLSRKNLPRTIFASANYMSSAFVKENLSFFFPFTLPRKTCRGKTCQGKLASVYSGQFFLDKGTCQGKLASVN